MLRRGAELGHVDIVHRQRWPPLHFLRACHREGSAHVLPALMATQARLGAGVALTLQNSFKQSLATWRGLQLQRCWGDPFGLVKTALTAFGAAAWSSVYSGHRVGRPYSFPTD